MKNAKENRAIAEAKIAQLEQEEFNTAEAYIKDIIAPQLEARANEGYFTIRINKHESCRIHAKVETLLRKNGYTVNYADAKSIRISW